MVSAMGRATARFYPGGTFAEDGQARPTQPEGKRGNSIEHQANERVPEFVASTKTQAAFQSG